MKQKPPKITEAQFQNQVIELAQLSGWRVAHFRAAQTNKGWRTPVSADGAGFPDLVMIRDGQVIFAELKGEKGKLSPNQDLWLEALVSVALATRHVLAVVWRPSDWDELETVLRSRRAPR